MTREETRDLAAAYALGALDAGDRGRFELLLRAGDADAVDALNEFETTLTGLSAEHVVTPPASVKTALMARIAAQGQIASPAPVTRRSWWPALWATALAAGLGAIVVGLYVSVSYERRLDTLAREAAALHDTLVREQQIIALVRDPATAIVALNGLDPAPSAHARMLWNPPAGGLLVVAGLPPAPEGKTYQLWAIAGKEPPVSAGIFSVDAKGTGSLRVSALPGIRAVDVFAVTVEPAGGLPAPSGKMYLASKS